MSKNVDNDVSKDPLYDGAAAITELPYCNDTIIAFFFAATKIKTKLKLLWPLVIVNLRIPGLI